jgi:hypothetical protein
MNTFTFEGKPLTSEHLDVIFSNVEMILGFNKLLLSELQKKQDIWDEVTLIGDVFLKLVISIM